MSKIVWDESGKHFYETGTDHGVLYPQVGTTYPNGVAWNGLTGVTQSPSGADSNPQYADNIKYLDLRSAEEFGGTIEAFSYPPEFAACDGSAEIAPGVTIGQQNRTPFGFSYRTRLGNDTEGVDHGYILHLVYSATASPSERAYQTINDSPEAITFSWEFTTTPINVELNDGRDYKPTALLEINSTLVDKSKLTALEEILYGTTVYAVSEDSTPVSGTKYFVRSGSEGAYVYTEFTGNSFVSGTDYYVYDLTNSTNARLPLPAEVYNLLKASA